MSASQAPPIDTLAIQLAGALELYERDMERLIGTWLDVDLYHAVTGHVDRIRFFATALPQASLVWVELLIAHSELVHSLWRLRLDEGGPGGGAPEGVLSRHAAGVAAMKACCLRLLSNP
jgi:hypothetical protein